VKTLYLECKSGISGDMFVGSMLDLGVESDGLLAALKQLPIDGYNIEITRKLKNGITATDFNVILQDDRHNHDDNEHTHHNHNTFSDIKMLINTSTLSENVKALSIKIFEIIAIAESKVHMTDIDNVHFHEVGAVDSIVDIVAAAYCVEKLSPDRIICSTLTEGSGFVKSAHGLLPVPCPATLEIFKNATIPFECIETKGELVTPTGAAIIAAIAQNFGVMPLMIVENIGYGSGKKDFDHANVLRAFLGSPPTQNLNEQLNSFSVENLESLDQNGEYISNNVLTDKIAVLETCIDDSTGEALGYCLDLLLEAGANDAFYTPVYMKKNRPAYQLTVLCSEENIKKLAQLIFTHTGSIGMRVRISDRLILQRQLTKIATKYGDIAYKTCNIGDAVKLKPEFEAIKAAAKEFGVTLNDVNNEFFKSIAEMNI
jgi:uncharacterized protein (TIGR00299 family) protein